MAVKVKRLRFFLVALGVISRFLIHVLEWFSRICPWYFNILVKVGSRVESKLNFCLISHQLS